MAKSLLSSGKFKLPELPKSLSLAGLMGGSSTAVGLSIGTSSIKMVELKRVGKVWKLIHFGIVQLPEDVIVNREIINPISVTDSIRVLSSQIKLSTKSVCTALSGTSMIIKRMNLDVPKLRELQDQVFWEAEQYIPFDVADVVMDFQMLSRGKDHKTDVLLVAVKRSVLDTYMACISEADLKPAIVDVDFFALQNLFEFNYQFSETQAAALVDIGASSTKIVIVHAGIPVFTKDSSMGGKNLTSEIQKHLGISYVDAEALKTGGLVNEMPQEVSELMHVMAENFAIEIKRAIDFYNASSSGAPVAGIYLAGGSAKIPELSRIVEESTGIPTQMINPFNAISYDPDVFTPEYMNAIAPLAAIPLGLALRAGALK